MLAILPPNSLALLEFQKEKYTELLEAARINNKTVEERAFLRKELHNVKQQLKTYYN
ncbi:MAG: hypothetical protein KA319_14155 [Ferruginibacter sp.]|nr:hypothetical protein [Ferruginibacter sp.]